MDRAISGGMGQKKMARDMRCLEKPAFAPGRKFAQKIPQRGVDVGLVEGAPVAAQVLQRGDTLLRVALEQRHRSGQLECASFLKPEWVGEMMQGNERPYAALAQGRKHLAVTLERVFVPLAFTGLDPAPLQRQPQ